MEDVISRYMKDVVNPAYPAEKETVFMTPEEALAFAQEMKWERKIDELRSAKKNLRDALRGGAVLVGLNERMSSLGFDDASARFAKRSEL